MKWVLLLLGLIMVANARLNKQIHNNEEKIALTNPQSYSVHSNKDFSAEKAIDGDPKTIFHSKGKGSSEWWKATFEKGRAKIKKVKFLSRKDCCHKRQNGAEIRIDDEVCGALPNDLQNGKWYEVICSKPIEGSSVKVIQKRQTEPLQIAGIEVYGGPINEEKIALTNPEEKIALTNPQSNSVHSNKYSVEKAIDGDSKTMFHSKGKGSAEWWKATFEKGRAKIKKVKFLTRKDCCHARQNGAEIRIGNEVCGALPNGLQKGKWYEVICSNPIEGSSVRVIQKLNNPLQIAGIEVYGGPINQSSFERCGMEHQPGRCKCTGTVYYGPYKIGGKIADFETMLKGNKYSKNKSNGSIACNNQVFGDPAYGSVKQCFCEKKNGDKSNYLSKFKKMEENGKGKGKGKKERRMAKRAARRAARKAARKAERKDAKKAENAARRAEKAARKAEKAARRAKKAARRAKKAAKK